MIISLIVLVIVIVLFVRGARKIRKDSCSGNCGSCGKKDDCYNPKSFEQWDEYMKKVRTAAEEKLKKQKQAQEEALRFRKTEEEEKGVFHASVAESRDAARENGEEILPTEKAEKRKIVPPNEEVLRQSSVTEEAKEGKTGVSRPDKPGTESPFASAWAGIDDKEIARQLERLANMKCGTPFESEKPFEGPTHTEPKQTETQQKDK